MTYLKLVLFWISVFYYHHRTEIWAADGWLILNSFFYPIFGTHLFQDFLYRCIYVVHLSKFSFLYVLCRFREDVIINIVSMQKSEFDACSLQNYFSNLRHISSYMVYLYRSLLCIIFCIKIVFAKTKLNSIKMVIHFFFSLPSSFVHGE